MRYHDTSRWISRAVRIAGGAFAAVALLAGSSGVADAQDDALLLEPPRYLALGSAGVPLRLTVDEDFGQDRLGVTFADLLLGYVLPGRSYRHGFGVGVSWNLGHDGGYVAPIYTGDQLAIMPAYLGYLPLGRDVAFIGHLGLPIVVHGGVGPGLELGAALAYKPFAGAGVFAELDLAGFAAGAASVSLLASLEAGIVIDYEVLP